jgi:hypothetical protein
MISNQYVTMDPKKCMEEAENRIRGRAPWSPFLNFLKIDIFKFQKILN